nr:NAD(P)-dependent alcohol dehydrogenase [uncultured Pseudodesulfovibrio sp.]
MANGAKIAAGVGLTTAFGAGLTAGASEAQAKDNAMAESTVRAWGADSKEGHFHPMDIKRRAVGPNDVKMDILFAGICHSDIHTVHSDWGPAHYPLVPGHEMVGRVVAVGSNVTRFKVGDVGGVGCMVDSCGVCENCKADREQNCLNGTTFTYDSEDKVSGGFTYGGYSKAIVVKEHFVVNIPDNMDLSRVAPIMCAGITTFSPMQHWELMKGQNLAVIGLGGLGHMAVKLGAAHGANVTVFTTTQDKMADAKKMGAKEAVLWSDEAAFKRYQASFDLMISTVPVPFKIQPFLNLLKLDATLVNVGDLFDMDGINGMALAFGRHSLAGSMIGGMKETQAVVDYCASHNIAPDVEIIKPSEIERAYQSVVNKEARYRFVIDMQNA